MGSYSFSRGFPNPVFKPRSPALEADSLSSEPQQYCSEQPIPSPVDLPDPGIKPGSSALQADALPTEWKEVSSIYWACSGGICASKFKVSSYGTGALKYGLNSGRIYAMELKISVARHVLQGEDSLLVELWLSRPGSVVVGHVLRVPR